MLLEINSPGGSTTASDILYHEIQRFKETTNVKVVAAFMDVAASGGYYLALPSDLIVAHPTAVTGSIGVVMVTPKVAGLMDKIGVAVEVNKSGSEKDMGSPFRASTPEEQRILQELIAGLGARFLSLVAKHRGMDSAALAGISTARVYSSEEALGLKLVDRIGYVMTPSQTRSVLPASGTTPRSLPTAAPSILTTMFTTPPPLGIRARVSPS